MSASIGVAIASGACSTVQVMRDADAAMYSAKRAGKGRIQFHGLRTAYSSEAPAAAAAIDERAADGTPPIRNNVNAGRNGERWVAA